MQHGFGARMAVLLVAVSVLSACAARTSTHGWAPTDAMLQEIVPGVDSRAAVEDTIGAPTTSGVLDDGGFYYIESTMSAIGPAAPRVVDRRIVAITFDDTETVANIETYGLEDGRVVPISRRVTQAPDSNIGFIRRLFGNIGGLSAEELLN